VKARGHRADISSGMDLSSFLRRLRYEAMPSIPESEEEAAWPAAEETEASADRPSVPWCLSQQDVHFLKRRLLIDPEI